jgi:hypothetical protein
MIDPFRICMHLFPPPSKIRLAGPSTISIVTEINTHHFAAYVPAPFPLQIERELTPPSANRPCIFFCPSPPYGRERSPPDAMPFGDEEIGLPRAGNAAARAADKRYKEKMVGVESGLEDPRSSTPTWMGPASVVLKSPCGAVEE